MPDETVTIRYEADTTRYAAGARRVSQDLDKIAAKAARAEAAAARATRAESRRGLAGAGRVAGLGGFGDIIGGSGSNPAISGGLIAAYGVKKMVDAAREADPEMAKLGESIASTVGPSAQVNETLIRLGNAFSVLANIGKNVLGTAIAGLVTMLTALAGNAATVLGNVANVFGIAPNKFGNRLKEAGSSLFADVYNDVTGSGRGGVVEMQKKLEEALERRRKNKKAEDVKTAATNSNNVGSLGFQGSAGLYVTSGGAMMANQSITIQRSMLRQLQSITHATEQVTQAIRENSYGGQ